MEQLRLVIPDISLAEEIRAYRADMLKAGSSLDGCGGLNRFEDPAVWLEVCRQAAQGRVPPGRARATQYTCLNEAGRMVGMANLRHHLAEGYLADFGGHVGYSVRPDFRRRGYAVWMLRAVMAEAKKLGIPRLLITCNQDNEGSRRTILRCGGVYESTLWEQNEQVRVERYWIDV